MMRITLCLAAVLVCSGPAFAAPTDPRPVSPSDAVRYTKLVSDAATAVQHNDLAGAAALYRQALRIKNDDGSLYVALGDILYDEKQYSDAANQYEQARARGFFNGPLADYKVAKCFVRLGNKDAAILWLQRALRARLRDRSEIARDADFSVLRNDPRFRTIIGDPARPIADRATGWRYDIDFLTSEIERLDPPYGNGALPPEYWARARHLKSNVASLNDRQIALEIMRLFATLGQAHSVMFPFGMKRGVLGMLDLQFYQFSDGIYVINAADPNRDLIGGKLLKVGGRDVGSLAGAVVPYISRDSDSFLPAAVPVTLTFADLVERLGAIERHGSLDLTVLRDGVELTKSVAVRRGPIDPDMIALKLIAPQNGTSPVGYLAGLDQPFVTQALDSESIYARLTQLQDDQHETLAQFADRLNDTIKQRKPKNLIVDLRLNNGGDYESTFPILQVLFAFEKSRPDARLFVIAGRETQSAAQNFLSTLDVFGGAIVVGEPSGSKPDHVGDDTLVVLPYSGIMGSVACAIHQTSYRDLRLWIAPAIPVTLSSSDYFHQRDPALKAIEAFLKGP